MTSGLREFLSRVLAVQSLLLFPILHVRRRFGMLSLPRKADASRPRVSGGTKPVSVRAIRTEQELAAFAPQWRALFNAANCRLPFVHLSWIEQWWRAFGGSLPLRRNELAIPIAEDAGRPVGILPLYRTTYGVASGFGMRYVRPLGSDANLTEVRTALMLPGYESAVLA